MPSQDSSVAVGPTEPPPGAAAADIHPATRRRWFRQVLWALLPLTLVVAVTETVAGLYFDDPALLLIGPATAALVVVLVACLWLVGRNATAAAIGIFAASILGLTLLTSLLAPSWYPAVVFGPLIVAVLLMPYVSPPAQRTLLTAAWATAVLVAARGISASQVEAPGAAAQAAILLVIHACVIGILLLGVHQYGHVLIRFVRDLATARDQLRTSNRRLLRLQAAQTDFFNRAAHELSTPMTPIDIQLHMVEQGAFGPVTVEQGRSLDMVRRNLQRMHRLVSEILDVSRLHAGRLVKQRALVDLAALAEENGRFFEPVAHRKGLTLETQVHGPLPVLGDAERLAQVLANLLSNALKFTPHGGRVTLAATHEDRHAIVELRDTGMGMDAPQLERLFEPFAQVHELPPSQNPGAGLGLYVSRGIVRSHGGSLTGRSSGPGGGATFRITLPLARAAPERADGGATASAASLPTLGTGTRRPNP